MTAALKRAIRTLLQGATGALAGLFALGGLDVVPDWDFVKRLVIAAVLGAMASLCSFIQNSLEDKGVVKPILKEGS